MKRILVIEDNENNMELITFILEANNYQTLKAETGQEGVTLALQERPDFIILDIQLPDIMGTDVLKMIRSSEIGGSIPIIAMTSYAMAGDREKLLAAGCDGYIEKPIDPVTVMSQIEKAVGGPQ
jgi:two-component system cell cycle response regulator DivK